MNHVHSRVWLLSFADLLTLLLSFFLTIVSRFNHGDHHKTQSNEIVSPSKEVKTGTINSNGKLVASKEMSGFQHIDVQVSSEDFVGNLASLGSHIREVLQNDKIKWIRADILECGMPQESSLERVQKVLEEAKFAGEIAVVLGSRICDTAVSTTRVVVAFEGN